MALLTAAPARADRPIADLARDTPISAYDDVVAWSAYEASTGRYRLITRRGTQTVAASIPGATRPFDVSLGPDSSGRTVALYTRCRTANHGCDVYRYDLRTHQERKLVSVSSPSLDEAWPAQWRDRITFARRARTHVIDGFDHRPDPRGRGPVLACDIPYVKTLGSTAPSRRLDRSQCGYTEGMAIRGETIVHVTGVNQGGAGSESQVRLLRARGGAARLLARAGGGEGGYSPFTEPSLSAGAVWLTRTGQRQGVQQGFLRINLRSHKLTTIPANLNLAGSVARDEHGTFWYVQGPEPGFDYHGERPYCTSPLEPCRLVRATADPFSSTPRALLPRLAIDGAQSQIIIVPAAAPAQLAGMLTRAVVTGGRVSGVEPVAGAPIQLLRADELERPTGFGATGLSTTTDTAGRWSITLNTPPPDVALAAFAPLLKIASTVVELRASATITLGVSGRSLTGTVAPSQPGRSVDVQRLIVDAQGRLPGGRQVCGVPVTADSCADEAWSTVVSAPLDATGSAFSATAPGPGDYRARLSFEQDARGRPTAYGGSSATVRVTV